MKNDLLLVGSVPLETAPEVLEMCGHSLGTHLPCIPDGETGDRFYWIQVLAYRVFHGHPDIETVKRPASVNGVEVTIPKTKEDSWQFKVRDGVNKVIFGDPGWRLGYAKDACLSYYVFKTLRDQGKIPKGTRFQVSLPLPNSAVDFFFMTDPRGRDLVRAAYEDAIRAEIAKMIEKIPPEDLCIQWDECVETMDVEGFFEAKTPVAQRVARHVGQIERLSPHIPESVMLGYHFCYGTLGGWPMLTPKDLSATVMLVNETVAHSGRRVDYVHIPILDTADDTYLKPLKDLKVGGAAIYYGAIHGMDDEAKFKERLRLLKKYSPKADFGLASYCGLGRHQAEEIPGVLKEHLRASQILHEAAA